MTELEFLAPPQRIEIPAGEDLLLRELYEPDAPQIYALMEKNRDRIGRFTDGIDSERDLANQIFERHNHNILQMAITLAETGQPIGETSLWNEEGQEATAATVGYWIDKDHIGHGYAAGAVQALANYAFENTDTDRLVARVEGKRIDDGEIVPGNTASSKTLLKAGFQLTEIDSKNRIVTYELLKQPQAKSSPVQVN